MRLLLQDSKNKIEGFYVVEVVPAPIGAGTLLCKITPLTATHAVWLLHTARDLLLLALSNNKKWGAHLCEMNPSFFVISKDYPTRRGGCLTTDRFQCLHFCHRPISMMLQAYGLPQRLPLLQEALYIPFSYIVYFLFLFRLCFSASVGADRCVCPIFAVCLPGRTHRFAPTIRCLYFKVSKVLNVFKDSNKIT